MYHIANVKPLSHYFKYNVRRRRRSASFVQTKRKDALTWLILTWAGPAAGSCEEAS
jgi:hypothetical protein